MQKLWPALDGQRKKVKLRGREGMSDNGRTDLTPIWECCFLNRFSFALVGELVAVIHAGFLLNSYF
jgi:hypothetical protein